MRYRITFFDYWHLGSGLSGGARHDASVTRDADGLPCVPGKTLKGVLREAAQRIDSAFVAKCFGSEVGATELREGACYFSNATLSEVTRQAIIAEELAEGLYTQIASTAIGDDGLAVDHSLREIEVVVPLTLYGEILHCNNETALRKAMALVKRMGMGRHRGLGRCEITVHEGAAL